MPATSLPVAQWLERPADVRKVMGSIPVGDSHARDMLNIPCFLISSPSLKLTIFLYLPPLLLLYTQWQLYPTNGFVTKYSQDNFWPPLVYF